MIRGLYTAASGMMVQVSQQETVTNNLSNSETNGFKYDLALQRASAESNVTRIPRQQQQGVIGRMTLQTLIDSIHTSHAEGVGIETGRALDLAIAGRGFFAVETPQGIRYTRNGAFTLDAERYLVTEQGYRVLGNQGPLQLPAGEVQIQERGQIFVDGEAVGQLRLADFADLQALRKEGATLWAAEQGELAFNGEVRQGFLEGSNVQVAEEMSRMRTALRLYESNQRVLQAHDQLTGKAVNEIGSL